MSYPPKPREQLFAERTMPEPNSGCLLWTGPANGLGYGRIHVVGTRRRAGAHRVAFEVVHGPVPQGMEVCHRCDTPSCVNVDHLFLGTHRDNMADMAAKGRSRPFFRERKRTLRGAA